MLVFFSFYVCLATGFPVLLRKLTITISTTTSTMLTMVLSDF